MNEKLNLNDLAGLLAEKSNIPKRDAELFLREYFALISETISVGESLKISGLGVFKSVWVEPRASINVQTGESFQIEGRYKLSFTPEKALRDLINTPFSCFETVVLNDGYNEPECKDMTSEEDDMSADESASELDLPSTEEPAELPLEEEVLSASVQPQPTQERDETVPQKNRQETNKNEFSVVLLPVEDPNESELDRLAEEKQRIEKSEKQTSILKKVAIALLICCVIAIGAVVYMVYEQNRFFTEDETLVQPVVTQPIVELLQKDSLPDTGDSLAQAALTPGKDTVEVGEPVAPIIETISNGVFLTKLALKHFGHKAFWVYIYEENKVDIPNPDAIPIGTKLVIPPKSKYNIDANNASSIQKAKDMAAEIKRKKS